MEGGTVDFGRTASDYAQHRAGFPVGLYERMHKHYGLLTRPSRIVDLGSGTGTIARHLASEGHEVVAVDPSESMLATCRELEDVDPKGPYKFPIQYKPNCGAEQTGIEDSGAYDIVIAGQSWHWFDTDAALAEVKRLLKPSPPGVLVIAHFDWLMAPGTVGQKTSSLMSCFNHKWDAFSRSGCDGTGFYPKWTVALEEHGFRNIETFSFVERVPYTHEAWCGRTRASAAIGASGLSSEEIARFDSMLRKLLETEPDPMILPHRCFAICATAPPSTQD